MKTMGLLAGMSWESSSVYYQLINRGIQQRLGGVHSAKVLMYSFDFGEVSRLQQAARWDEATARLYPTSPSAQRKGGPRFAFLSLCEAGLVKGIPAGQYAPSNKNKAYALRAVSLLNAGTHKTVTTLWAEVTDGEPIAHNSQMDVVLALWKNDLIVRNA